MKGGAKHYEELRAYLETVPLVDSHDHTATCGPKYADPISVIAVLLSSTVVILSCLP